MLLSEDLEELFMICDRIAVMHEGHFMGVVDPTSCDFEKVGMSILAVSGS
jgi:simple sugar transport system ATP-binding protein